MPNRALCLIHANCQGEPLADLLCLSPDFARLFQIRHYTNYTKEPVPQQCLDTASVFLYQHMAPCWKEVSSEALLARLAPSAARFCIPNPLFKGYWPFWTSHGAVDFGDTVLDRLIDAGAQKPEILKIYLGGDVRRFADLDAVAASSLAHEYKKEVPCDVKTAHIVEELWRKEPLFYTVNHPGKRLLLQVADAVIDFLGLPPLSSGVKDSYEPEYAEFEQPIHPQLAEHMGLPFARTGHEFRIYKRRMDFARYVSRYIDCRQQGMAQGFQAYLQLV